MSRTATSQFEPDCREVASENRGVLGVLGKRVISAIRLPAVWIPAVVLVALTAFFRFTDADMTFVRQFFVGGAAGSQLSDRWPMMETYPWKALYDWGIYPAWILGGGGLVFWVATFVWTKLEPWRDAGLFYGLLLLIGPGVIVNGVLKPFWGRPRPNNVVAFGGQREFLPVLVWGRGQDESSFPSGHASTGFYLMAPAFVCYRRRRRLALAFLLLGLVSGGVMGLTRIVAGGHFPSDVLWAWAIVYFSALAIAAPFRFGDSIPPIWKRSAAMPALKPHYDMLPAAEQRLTPRH
jgi:lipid A 4'-phosphatase